MPGVRTAGGGVAAGELGAGVAAGGGVTTGALGDGDARAIGDECCAAGPADGWLTDARMEGEICAPRCDAGDPAAPHPAAASAAVTARTHMASDPRRMTASGPASGHAYRAHSQYQRPEAMHRTDVSCLSRAGGPAKSVW